MAGITRRVAVVFAAFAAAHFMSTFVRSTNAVIADDLVRDIGLTASELGLMTSLLFLVFAAVQLPLGSALDRFGARWVTSGTMLAAVAGSLVFAAGESFMTLAIGRALMGVGTAGILMGGFKALSGYLSTRRFATVSGLLVAVGSSGALVAATPLAWLAQTVGWRLVFVGGSVALLAAAAGVAVFGRAASEPVSETPAESEASDGGFAGIFGRRRFWPLAAMAVATAGVSFSFQALWAGPYLVNGRAMSGIAAGNVLFALSLGVILGYLLWGWLGARLGPARALVIAVAIYVAVQVVLGFLPPVGSGLLTVLFFVFGLAASASVLLFVLVRSLFPFGLTGRAVTAVNLFMFGGGFVLQWALGVMAEWTVPSGGQPNPGAYGAMFFVTAGIGLAALVWFLPSLPAWRRDIEKQA